jgi:hypothetical protein
MMLVDAAERFTASLERTVDYGHIQLPEDEQAYH